ncbi:MAG: hypothetical protein PUP46_04555 [Endozoicomonas sp. (ex Botrylloides leachii)]|nr:hypothetical protein [Endozoicomonas sp. (ex Botrylloides leachii)]
MSNKIKKSLLKASVLAIPLALVTPQTVALLIPESSTIDPANFSAHHAVASMEVASKGETELKSFGFINMCGRF